MDVITAIRERRSVRSFQEEPVPSDTLQEVLEAGLMAPSAGNLQPWHFVVVTRGGLRRKLAETTGDPFPAQAPAIIAVCVDPERSGSIYGDRGRHLYCLQDAAAAIQNMMLAAIAHGLGTCWIGAFSEAQAAEVLGLSRQWRPVALLPLGYPARTPRVPPRRPPEDVVTFLE